MDFKEISQISIHDECNHWWIKTRFLYLRRSLKFNNQSVSLLREYGSGTGQNLWYLSNFSSIKELEGVDPSLSEDFASPLQDDRIQFVQHSSKRKASHVVLMDVLEHIEDTETFLWKMREELEDEAIVFITVPAFSFFWSYHDEILGHRRRYTKQELKLLMEKNHFTTLKLHYAFSPFFFLIYFIRLIKNNFSKRKTDLKKPLSFFNSILYCISYFEYLLGGNPFFGTSVVGIFKYKPQKM